jgi:hypothetical protein
LLKPQTKVDTLLLKGSPSAGDRIRETRQFGPDDIDLLVRTLESFNTLHDTPWDDFREAHCVLPNWFRQGLDPLTPEYAAQQRQLWSTLSGVQRAYSAEIDEREAELAAVDTILVISSVVIRRLLSKPPIMFWPPEWCSNTVGSSPVTGVWSMEPGSDPLP